jgi:hypothetical protein
MQRLRYNNYFRRNSMITNEQQAHLDALRLEWAAAADAAREYDRLADLIEREGRMFSPKAHEEAVVLLRDKRDEQKGLADSLRFELKESSGWQTFR